MHACISCPCQCTAQTPVPRSADKAPCKLATRRPFVCQTLSHGAACSVHIWTSVHTCLWGDASLETQVAMFSGRQAQPTAVNGTHGVLVLVTAALHAAVASPSLATAGGVRCAAQGSKLQGRVVSCSRCRDSVSEHLTSSGGLKQKKDNSEVSSCSYAFIN